MNKEITNKDNNQNNEKLNQALARYFYLMGKEKFPASSGAHRGKGTPEISEEIDQLEVEIRKLKNSAI